MLNNNFFTDNYEFVDPSLLSTEMPFYFPPIEPFPDITQDLFNYSEFEGMESSQVYQLFDQVFQNYTKDLIKYIPNPLENPFPYEEKNIPKKIRNSIPSSTKIGTITVEERRIKVQKFLEKRKRRVYTKKISYLCRKRVADTRERYKGRFVAKKTESTMVQNSNL